MLEKYLNIIGFSEINKYDYKKGSVGLEVHDTETRMWESLYVNRKPLLETNIFNYIKRQDLKKCS